MRACCVGSLPNTSVAAAFTKDVWKALLNMERSGVVGQTQSLPVHWHIDPVCVKTNNFCGE